jgi:hypothetical protein
MGEPMRDLPDVKIFPSGLIDDMHQTFDAVCARLRLAPQSDKATALVVTKIVELAKAGHRGDDLTVATLKLFDACEPERRSGAAHGTKREDGQEMGTIRRYRSSRSRVKGRILPQAC